MEQRTEINPALDFVAGSIRVGDHPDPLSAERKPTAMRL